MTLVCSRPGFYHFLMDEQQIFPSSHPQLTLLYPSAAVPPPSIPQSHFPSSISFVLPRGFLLPLSAIPLSPLTLSPRPSLAVTLWIFCISVT